MITKIKDIRNLGIYKNYKADSQLKEFNKYNLFYGWNGSGKTTISKLFRMLEKKEIPIEYRDITFNIEINSQKYSEKNFSNNKEKIFVFNEEFIEDNINWDEKINKILLLSKDKIAESKEYNALKEELFGSVETKTKGLKDICMQENEKLSSQLKDIEETYSKIAKNIKGIFQTIDSSDRLYSSLNKTKVENIIIDLQKLEEIKNTIVNKEDVDKLIISVQSDKRELIKEDNKKIDLKQFADIYYEISSELSNIVTAKVIERLKDNTDIATWVNQGLQIRNKYNNETCEFCGGPISKERIIELEGHFNDEVSKSKERLTAILEKLKMYNIEVNNVIVDKNQFYKEYEGNIEILNKDIKECVEKIENSISLINKKVEEKIKNPFNKIEVEGIESINTLIQEYNKKIVLQENYIKESNQKTINYEKQIAISKDTLYKYYLKNQFEQEDIFSRNKRYKLERQSLEIKNKELQEKERRLNLLESTLSNETLGAEKFNEKLNAFIGYDELKLNFNKALMGYEIIRKSTNSKATHLSEGEKTAIAFVYFLTKIKENDNKIEESIIVIDDPISSFDNNKLFNAYSSIKYEFEKCQQLFVLTHNFSFFKLIRDWVSKKRDSNKNKIYAIYKVEPSIEKGIRIGNIKNAGKSLNQTSEYDYIFDCVYKYKDKELEENDIFNCGNASRKLLEAFLSFKFPNQRGDIQSLLDMAFDKKEESQIKTKVYKFINAYSHLNVIESTDVSDIDTLLAESKGIVNIILNKIEELDQKHYSAMVHNSVSTAEI